MSETPGRIEIDDSGREPRIRLTLPQEWFTLTELRQFAAYLTLTADENEPSPEVEELAEILEACALTRQDYRSTARAVLRAGYRLPDAKEERLMTATPGQEQDQ